MKRMTALFVGIFAFFSNAFSCSAGSEEVFNVVSQASLSVVATASTPLGGSFSPLLEKRISEVFSPIHPDLDSFQLGLEMRVCSVFPKRPASSAVSQGILSSPETFLGSGTVAFKRGRFAYFALSSRYSYCVFSSRGASSSFYLRTPDDEVMFSAGPGERVPYPSLRIARDGESFRLDIQMLLQNWSASCPIDLDVHPDASAYLVRRIRENFPVIREFPDRMELLVSETASPGVILRLEDGRIVGFQAFFGQDQNSRIHITVDPLGSNGPIPEPSGDIFLQKGRRPTSGFDEITAFVKGFYRVLADFFPQAESSAKEK
ncbi:MAG: hypothetical protein WA705_10735 [Candidatus Ozemobacteraceae bacterium]